MPGIKSARVLNIPGYSYNNIIISVTNVIILEFFFARFVHLGAWHLLYLILTRIGY